MFHVYLFHIHGHISMYVCMYFSFSPLPCTAIPRWTSVKGDGWSVTWQCLVTSEGKGGGMISIWLLGNARYQGLKALMAKQTREDSIGTVDRYLWSHAHWSGHWDVNCRTEHLLTCVVLSGLPMQFLWKQNVQNNRVGLQFIIKR